MVTMTNLKRTIRRYVQRLGFDLTRYPLQHPLARTVKLMEHHRVNLVLDVGANDGGFATGLRDLGYTGQIISFEPLQRPFHALRRRAENDPQWDVVQVAVGDTVSQVTINVAGNDGLSSSVLPMLDAHIIAAPESRYTGVEKVSQVRLDGALSKFDTADTRTFLKIDVQGYEKYVLDGASGLFATDEIIGLQIEVCLASLYEGAPSYRDLIDYVESLGMTLMGLDPVFSDPYSGRLLQADAVFFRDGQQHQ